MKKIPAFITHHYLPLLIAVVAFAFVSRIYRLNLPTTYIFDEVYHAVTAKLMRRNDHADFEWWNPPPEPNTAVDWLHPPLAKYTQAFAMNIYGENSFGWRISSVLFGTLVIIVTAKLAFALFESKPLSLLAAFLASLDGLLLTQSRIAMNDIHVTFFILLTFLLYVRYRKHPHHLVSLLFLTGVAAGFAMATKWSGVFALSAVWIFEVLNEVAQNFSQSIFVVIKNIVKKIPFLFIIPIFIYIASYSYMFMQGKSLVCEGNQIQQGQCYCSQDSSLWVTLLKKIPQPHPEKLDALEARGGCKQLISHFNELHHQIWTYQTTLKATHPFQSRPYQWFLDLRPVWFYVDYNKGTASNIYALGNPLLFWFGDIAVAVTLIAILTCFSFKKLKIFQPLLFLLVGYLIVWLPWQLSPRIMFFYHYTPAVPLLSIILAYWLQKVWREKIVIHGVHVTKLMTLFIVLSIAVTFVVWYPDWTGIPVPEKFAQAVYFVLPSWK